MDRLEYIQALLRKAATNSISIEELDTLLAWLDDPQSTQFMPQVCQELQIDEKRIHTIIDKASHDKQWERLLDVISTEDHDEMYEEEAYVPHHRNLFRWSVAASLLVAVSLSSIWYFKHAHEPQATVQSPRISIADSIVPGSTKAILITNGGQRIELDSSAGKVLVKGSNYSIATNAQGQLVNNENGKPQEVVTNTVATPNGGQYDVILPDGTMVKLNAASSITYPSSFLKEKRIVSVTGEAYFEVSKDAHRPFIVRGRNGMEVEVLGTHFDVNSYADESTIKTTLLEGAVKVSAGPAVQYLKPSQQAQLADNGSLKLLTNVDVGSVVAWKDGIFQFNDMDIKSVMRELARWYNIDVVYNGKVPTDLFSAVINRQNNIGQVLSMLQNTLRVHFLIKNKTIYVSD